ncbi:MAG: GntR family transcriptional regulator [Aliishimia sp.]
MKQAAKSKLVGGAYERLKHDIRMNLMPPGFQATEPEIALRLGMSRTPVREALIRLEAEGLIEMIPRRGVRVVPIRAEDMQEIYEMLTALEPEAAAQIARRGASEAELAPLEDATRAMEGALADGDLDGWAQADDTFHTELLALHGNRRMMTCVQALFDQAHRARIVTLRMRALPLRSTQEHRMILERIRAGDGEGTYAAFRAHRARAAEELLGLLQDYRLPGL